MRKLLMATALAGAIAMPAGSAPTRHAPARAHPAMAAHPNWVATLLRTPEGGVRMGNPRAAISLIEYGSRTCPHCALFDAEGLPVIKSKYIATGQLSYEFRDFPVHGVLDMGPILLGQCVTTAQFFPMLNQMMAAQSQLMKKDDIPAAEQEKLRAMKPASLITWLANYYGYTDFAARHGLTPAKARACLGDVKAIEAIAKSADAANARYAIPGTPTFIVNGKVAKDVFDWKALEPVLTAAGAK
ncbi:hypothetical protein GCM10009087_03910 [Sphingomonas oligophenolica]|uniref:Thioredoxin domain-containing protein n=1 Tax=Sphingomonas oligophenolica TaxID=301154 RepID=A0ABU9Y610_9SPHN